MYFFIYDYNTPRISHLLKHNIAGLQPTRNGCDGCIESRNRISVDNIIVTTSCDKTIAVQELMQTLPYVMYTQPIHAPIYQYAKNHINYTNEKIALEGFSLFAAFLEFFGIPNKINAVEHVNPLLGHE